MEGKNFRGAPPWIAIFPGCSMAVSVQGLNLFRDAVRDAMDPRLRTWAATSGMSCTQPRLPLAPVPGSATTLEGKPDLGQGRVVKGFKKALTWGKIWDMR